MKRRITALILCVACVLTFAACVKSKDVSDKTEYDIELTLAEDLKSASLNQKVVYKNTEKEALDQITFDVYANAYSENVSYPAYFNALTQYGGIKINEVTVNGEQADLTFNKDLTLMTVNLSTPLMSGKSAGILINADITVPECDLRFGLTEGVLNLADFYPIITTVENGEFRKDEYSKIGDPYFYKAADYSVKVNCKSGLVIAAGGEKTEIENGDGTKSVAFAIKDATVLAMSASYDYKVAETDSGDVKIKYYYKGEEKPDTLINTAAGAAATFAAAFGEYPYEVLSLAETKFYYGGMEYPGFVQINNSSENKEEIIIHETAHQWFAIAVNSDSVKNAWLDEALASFVENYYYLLNDDAALYKSQRDEDFQAYKAFIGLQRQSIPDYSAIMAKPIYDFETNYEYANVIYARGSLMFDAVLQFIGAEKMKAVLNDYYIDNKFKTAAPDDLYAAFNKNGCDVKPIFEAWLNDKVLMASFAQQR